MPEYIDTHAHIYLPDFDDDRDSAVERAIQNGVNKIILPNIDSTSITRLNNTVSAYPGICYALMGLHPTSVKENYPEELEITERLLKQGNYAGIGEIGIDLYWDKTHVEQQKSAFITQLEWSVLFNLPVVIHARESFAEILEAIKPFSGKIRGIFHAFSGTIDIARIVTNMGFKLGIGGMVTYKNSTLPDVVREISIDHLVLETDSPYLTPVPHRGKRNESSYIPYIAEAVHRIKNVPLDEVAKITTQNALEIFSFPGHEQSR
jgi:TatD DNase family protein